MNIPSVRMFVDENGNYCLNEDLSNDNNRFLCLTGIIMKIQEHQLLTKSIDELKLKHFGTTVHPLHRRELIAAKPPFDNLKDPAVRDSFNNEFLEIVDSCNYRVISIVIDKKALVNRFGIIRAQDPYSLALEYLMQRYQYWMQDYSSMYGHCYGDIVAEARGGREDRITKATYTAIYNGQGYKPLEDAGKYYSSKEIKLRKKKENIAGLQFVDLISHPARRYILSSNGLAPNIKGDSFEQQIVNILVRKKFRRNKSGNIEGPGTVLYPK